MKFIWILFVATLMLHLAYAEEGQQCTRNGDECSENEHCSRSKHVCVPDREDGTSCRFDSNCPIREKCVEGNCLDRIYLMEEASMNENNEDKSNN